MVTSKYKTCKEARRVVLAKNTTFIGTYGFNHMSMIHPETITETRVLLKRLIDFLHLYDATFERLSTTERFPIID